MGKERRKGVRVKKMSVQQATRAKNSHRKRKERARRAARVAAKAKAKA